MTVLDNNLRDALQLNAVVPHGLYDWPYVHTSMIKDSQLDFYGTDSESILRRNLRNMPETWIYRNLPITYKFNKAGLRMNKELEEVSSDYIMFCGTSYTMGMAINENKRFSNLVAEHVGLDFINNGGPTFTIKTHAISFFNFLKTNRPLPKILVLEYHKPGCYTYYSDDSYVHIHSSFGKLKHLPEGKKYEGLVEAYKHLATTDYFTNEAHIYRNMIKITCEKLGIKFAEITFIDPEPFSIENNIPTVNMSSNIEDINYCFGRDIRVRPEGGYYSHPGVGLHKEASELIIAQL